MEEKVLIYLFLNERNVNWLRVTVKDLNSVLVAIDNLVKIQNLFWNQHQ